MKYPCEPYPPCWCTVFTASIYSAGISSSLAYLGSIQEIRIHTVFFCILNTRTVRFPAYSIASKMPGISNRIEIHFVLMNHSFPFVSFIKPDGTIFSYSKHKSLKNLETKYTLCSFRPQLHNSDSLDTTSTYAPRKYTVMSAHKRFPLDSSCLIFWYNRNCYIQCTVVWQADPVSCNWGLRWSYIIVVFQVIKFVLHEAP